MNTFLASFLFPHFCVGCFRPGVVICEACIRKGVMHSPQRCLWCGGPSFLGLTHEKCKNHTKVNGIYSFFYYQPPLRQVIKSSKYRHNKAILYDLLSLLPLKMIFSLWRLKDIYPDPIATYVPQTPDVFRERGFNQSQVIAQHLATALRVPLYGIFEKLHTTKHQSQLPKQVRRTNLSQVFGLKINKNLHNILLIDDVVTTGSTVNELARVIKQHNPSSMVYVISVFRAS